MTSLRYGPLLLLLFTLSLVPAAAQELTTGTIAGKVTDPTGRAIAGAVLILAGIVLAELKPRTWNPKRPYNVK